MLEGKAVLYDLWRCLWQIHIRYLCKILSLKRHQVWEAQFLTCLCVPSPYPSLGNFFPFFLRKQWHLVPTGSAMVPDLHGLKGGKCITKLNQMSLQLCAGQPYYKWFPAARKGRLHRCRKRSYTCQDGSHSAVLKSIYTMTEWYCCCCCCDCIITAEFSQLSWEQFTPYTPIQVKQRTRIKGFRSCMQIQGPGLEGLLQIFASDSLCWMDYMHSSWQKCYQREMQQMRGTGKGNYSQEDPWIAAIVPQAAPVMRRVCNSLGRKSWKVHSNRLRRKKRKINRFIFRLLHMVYFNKTFH